MGTPPTMRELFGQCLGSIDTCTGVLLGVLWSQCYLLCTCSGIIGGYIAEVVHNDIYKPPCMLQTDASTEMILQLLNTSNELFQLI